MNDALMLEYLVQMGAMQPEEVEIARKQKQIDALRGQAMNTPQGQMVGKHYVPPSFTQYAAQLGQGYMAGQGQEKLKTQNDNLSVTQKNALVGLRASIEEERRKKKGGAMMNYGMPTYGTSEGE